MKQNKNNRPASPTKKLPAIRPKSKLVLRLFVAGATARSRRAVLCVQEYCATMLADSFTLNVVDIYQQPALARADQIVATPTLVVDFPRPARRFIGNLTNINGLFVEVNLPATGKIAV